MVKTAKAHQPVSFPPLLSEPQHRYSAERKTERVKIISESLPDNANLVHNRPLILIEDMCIEGTIYLKTLDSRASTREPGYKKARSISPRIKQISSTDQETTSERATF